MIDYTIYAIPAFIALMAVEALLLARTARRGYEARDTAASLAMGVGSLVVGIVAKAMHLALLTLVARLAPVEIAPSWASWIALLLLGDLAYYWFHRLSHEVRFLWAAHVNHHSSERYNLSTALRQSWTEHLFGPLFWWPLALIGVPVEALLVIEAVSLIYQYWLHTELVGKLGPFEWVFNTPSAHRVHHGRNLQYMDRNYGGILIIWDRLFGTYEPEREPVEYGITKNLDTYNPVRIAFHEWAAMIRDVAHARSLRAALGAIFAPPGWRADGNHETVRALMQRESHNTASAAAE